MNEELSSVGAFATAQTKGNMMWRRSASHSTLSIRQLPRRSYLSGRGPAGSRFPDCSNYVVETTRKEHMYRTDEKVGYLVESQHQARKASPTKGLCILNCPLSQISTCNTMPRKTTPWLCPCPFNHNLEKRSITQFNSIILGLSGTTASRTHFCARRWCIFIHM